MMRSMSPERAHTVLPEDTVITTNSTPNVYGGAWMVYAHYAVDAEGGKAVIEKRPVTQFTSPHLAARWVHTFESLRDAGA
jgi:hypothetical protein